MMNAREKNKHLPADTNAALREVMASMEGLSKVYTEETEALIAVDSQKFLQMQDKKMETAMVYHAHMTEMMGRKDEIQNADPVLKRRLKEIQQTFHILTEKNLEALDRMLRCTDKLAQTIRNAALRAAQSHRTVSYGENGALTNSSRNKVVSTGLSETA